MPSPEIVSYTLAPSNDLITERYGISSFPQIGIFVYLFNYCIIFRHGKYTAFPFQLDYEKIIPWAQQLGGTIVEVTESIEKTCQESENTIAILSYTTTHHYNNLFLKAAATFLPTEPVKFYKISGAKEDSITFCKHKGNVKINYPLTKKDEDASNLMSLIAKTILKEDIIEPLNRESLNLLERNHLSAYIIFLPNDNPAFPKQTLGKIQGIYQVYFCLFTFKGRPTLLLCFLSK